MSSKEELARSHIMREYNAEQVRQRWYALIVVVLIIVSVPFIYLELTDTEVNLDVLLAQLTWY